MNTQHFAILLTWTRARRTAIWSFAVASFAAAVFSITRNPALRTTVRNVRIVDCSQCGCGLDAAVCEEILVNGFKTSGQLFQIWGAVFKHVVLRGRIEEVMISNRLQLAFSTAQEREVFARANAKYYETVDWALDIRDAELKDLEIRGVPARLIRRDPETEIVVTRESAIREAWRDLPFKWPATALSIEDFLARQEPDCVLVAPKRNARFRDRLSDVRLLRKEGIAEPD